MMQMKKEERKMKKELQGGALFSFNNRILLVFLFSFIAVNVSFAADFGLLLDQRFEASNEAISYTPGFTPWFSLDAYGGLSVYLSGLVSVRYVNLYKASGDNGGWTFIPELGRFALGYRINQAMAVEAGRIGYSDALGFTAAGLFDGLRFTMATRAGNINIGAFYTGLLYKDTARIMMSEADKAGMEKPLDWDNAGTYAASRRIFAAARWDIPVGAASFISAELLGQFDVNGKDGPFHSQYGAVKADFYTGRNLRITAGGIFEAIETSAGAVAAGPADAAGEIETAESGGSNFYVAFGGLAQLKTEMPGGLNDWLGATVKYASGRGSGAGTKLYAFTPVTSMQQGMVFPGTLSGLVSAGVDYSARLHRTLMADAAFSYFIRPYGGPESDGNFYGGEVWASLIWQFLEDARASAGGGVFIPQMGNYYPSGTGAAWKISLGLAFSF